MGLTINQSALRHAEKPSRYASRMDKTKYETKEAKRSGLTLEDFRAFFDVTPCDCGKAKCKGWQARYKFRAERRREGNA